MEQHPSMNRIYRFDWSQTSEAWVVISENSRRQGKRSSRGPLTAALSLSAGVPLAGPTAGQIVAGSGSISHSGTTATIEKSSPTLTLTSQSFNVAPQHRIAINRIFGNSGTPLRLRTSTGRSGYQ
jgi:trimeric autotransporter adhesin